MFQQPVVLAQRLGVPGAELADGLIQEGPPLGGAGPDEGQVFRAEKDGLDHAGEFGGGLCLDVVDEELSSGAPDELGFQKKFPSSAFHLGGDRCPVFLEGDEFLVSPGPVGAGAGQEADGFQEIGFSLGVFSPDDVHPGGEGGGEGLVVAKPVQGDGADGHCTRIS